MDAMKSRARGCMLGQLCGDALGAQVEFKSAAEIRRRFPEGVTVMAASPVWNTLPGQITDDSEMALALARALDGKEMYDGHLVHEAYVAWLHSHPFDCGNTIYGSLMDHPNPKSQANGALMRVSPLGIWGVGKSRQALLDAAAKDAALTHVHPVCQQANQIFAALIAEAIATQKSGAELYKDLCQHPKNYSSDPLLPEIEAFIRKAESEKPVLDKENKGWVLLAFQNALYQMLHARSFMDAVVDSVMGGGDTDTNAAICGALMGAVCGEEAIPVQWKETVLGCTPDKAHGAEHPRPKCYWPADALELAERLLKGPEA
ncbi:MAG: ADP-ribosylglycohydrolase family protein [Desulfovibrionaceae bacterium]|nr:ADP-ribosylglycohydrolase family protein [Desulfovibrionaceae bacterium]